MPYSNRGYANQNPGLQLLQGVNMFVGGMEHIDKINDEKAINSSYDEIAKMVGDDGDISALQNNNYRLDDRHRVQAFGRYMLDRAKSEQGRLSMLKNMEAADDQYYQGTIRPLLFATQEAFKGGDMNRFAAMVSELSAKAPMPYKLVPNQDGTFSEMFRSDEAGGWADTGRKHSAQEAMQAVGYLMEGEQQILAGANMQKRIANPRYLAAAARYKMGTILGNAGNMADSNKWLNVSRDGKSMYAVPQNRHDDYSGGPNWLILDQATGKQIGIVDSLNGFGIHKKTKGGDGSGKEGAIDKRLEREILAGGFVKKDGWYYEPNADGEKVDLTKPLSSEAVRMFRDKLAGGGLGGQGNGAGSQSGNSLGLTRPGSAPPPQAAAPGSTPAQGVAGALASPAQPQQAPAQPQRQTEPASPQDLDYATSEDMKNWKNIELVSKLMPNGSYLTYGKTPDGRSIYLRPETARKIRENSRAASVERHKNDPTDFGIVPETF